ncbi:hypothetical protein [Massilia sp. BJB1822]|uniref:hypothetical protein n=1 Tax=Massilia sp. BJB1822 TaxID=2744470 RepID=UPI0015930254|nr:hypothetical protein [Massilia sp. BJB1822]NVE00689.1 hypothetical protein [Massilia sp. BJB1822]
MHKDSEYRGSKRERHIDREEDRVWAEFYRRVTDPSVAAELIAYMDQDSQVKARHAGLYLRCRQSLRREKARIMRARRVGVVVRALLYGVFVLPCSMAVKTLRFCGAAGMACAAPHAEPAITQLSKIGRGANASQTQDAPPAQEKPAGRRAKQG